MSNYETDLVILWLSSNDEDTYRTVLELLQEADPGEREQVLEDYVDENNPTKGTNSLYSNFISAALQEVQWDEVLEAFADELEDEEEEDEEPDLTELQEHLSELATKLGYIVTYHHDVYVTLTPADLIHEETKTFDSYQSFLEFNIQDAIEWLEKREETKEE